MKRLSDVSWMEWRARGVQVLSKSLRTKDPAQLQGDKFVSKSKLKRCLQTADLLSLGVGSCAGTGVFLVAGMVIRNVAGPGAILSFVVAALASVFSGACYAEFGVRLPHTSGSAYSYTYVTLGELPAFIIGWTLLLEYLIGTAAGAAALSACLDALADGAISRGVAGVLGHWFGSSSPPDVLAFSLTVGLAVLLAVGVQKSVWLSHVLNAITLATLTFALGAAIYFFDTDNWQTGGGFLPKGWSGVFGGAATAFYAFIGFDIIATTGEEATTPQRSIPISIILSLFVLLTAYVTSSFIITLMVPFDLVSAESGLVDSFGWVGATTCKSIVGVGALAGLGVSMFGSMFPLPRVAYSMAADGLIFRQLSMVVPATGTPVLATFVLGIGAALAALLFPLHILVEMMSIGTLLAYTLVSLCVLLLRYQPTSAALAELLPASLRTPVPGTPQPPSSPSHSKSHMTLPNLNGANYPPIGGGANANPVPGSRIQKVTVKKVTRGSPDSDDTTTAMSMEGDGEWERDDDYLVSERERGRFYGSAASRGSHTGPSRLPFIEEKLKTLKYLLPGLFPWIEPGPVTGDSGRQAAKLIALLILDIIILDIILVAAAPALGEGQPAAIIFVVLFFIIMAVLIGFISKKPQNTKRLAFLTPGVPLVPCLAVFVNIYLILQLNPLSIVRFFVWMILGLAVYFFYGIRHSSLGPDRTSLSPTSDNVEMADQQIPAPSNATQMLSSTTLMQEPVIMSSLRPDPLDEARRQWTQW